MSLESKVNPSEIAFGYSAHAISFGFACIVPCIEPQEKEEAVETPKEDAKPKKFTKIIFHSCNREHNEAQKECENELSTQGLVCAVGRERIQGHSLTTLPSFSLVKERS